MDKLTDFYYNRNAQIYELVIFKPLKSKAPFEKWFGSLKSKKTQQIIQARLDRAMFGNFGDFKAVGNNVFEFRIDFGPGYRVYFSIQQQKILLLLIGGNKRTQYKDIEKAKFYLKEWKENG